MKRLAIFARAPVRGRVKTRLARDIGADAALAAYRELLEQTLERLAPGRGDFAPELWLDGAPADLPRPPPMPVHAQPPGDLGRRMAAAFESGVAAVVGSDIPDLTAGYVAGALSALDDADAALGPTADGGYCLIALREPCRALFEAIPWSTPRVLAATLAAARHLRVALRPMLRDVDNGEDFRRWRAASAHPACARGCA